MICASSSSSSGSAGWPPRFPSGLCSSDSDFSSDRLVCAMLGESSRFWNAGPSSLATAAVAPATAAVDGALFSLKSSRNRLRGRGRRAPRKLYSTVYYSLRTFSLRCPFSRGVASSMLESPFVASPRSPWRFVPPILSLPSRQLYEPTFVASISVSGFRNCLFLESENSVRGNQRKRDVTRRQRGTQCKRTRTERARARERVRGGEREKHFNPKYLVHKVRDTERLVDLRHEILFVRLFDLRHFDLELLNSGYILGFLQFRNQVRLLDEKRL